MGTVGGLFQIINSKYPLNCSRELEWGGVHVPPAGEIIRLELHEEELMGEEHAAGHLASAAVT